MLSSLPLLSLALVALTASDALALPKPVVPAPLGQSVELRRRARPQRTPEQWGTWASNHKLLVESKYGKQSNGKTARRATGTNLLVNQNADSSFSGSIAIGTPPKSFEVILDTGSSDLWLAGTACTSGCASTTPFDETVSTSYTNLSTPFLITYGSGRASGHLGREAVQMGGFAVSNQVFAICDVVSSGLLSNPVSGLMGLAWQSISSSGAPPFWQTLAGSGTWDQPLMAFQLTRFLDNPQANTLEPGGQFNLGFTNTSLYTGDIDFQPIPSGEVSYWILPLTQISVGAASVPLGPPSSNFAAIDTGTTLIGGPKAAIAAIFAAIPGSAPGTGNFQGYYTYPCASAPTVSLSFGGRSWPIAPEDFRLTALSKDTCLGAFFELGDSPAGTGPSWIVGDTFLKNVYSVYRFNPPSVGFAQLSDTAHAASTPGTPPSATIDAVVVTVSASASARITPQPNSGAVASAATRKSAAAGTTAAIAATAALLAARLLSFAL